MRVCKIDNGLAVPLPADVVEALGLREGDSVQVRTTGINQVVVERRMTPAEMIEEFRKQPKIFPADFKFNREEANER